jgi:hypothetical protein
MVRGIITLWQNSAKVNPRKGFIKMKNLKKSTAKIAIFALSLGIFSVVNSTQANAHTAVANGASQANISLATVSVNASLVVATRQDNITAQIQNATAVAGTFAEARSLGLLTKDASSGTAQTATVRTGAVLSLYARTSTIAAMSATGGTFSDGKVGGAGTTVTYNSGNTAVLFASTGTYTSSGTPVAVLWTAPSTAGSYVVTLDVSGGTTDTNVTTTDPLVGTKAGEIEITVTNSINGTTVASDAVNTNALVGAVNSSLFVANLLSTSGAAVVSSIDAISTHSTSAKSLGLLSKDGSVGVAQSATMLVSGVLSLYASVSTDVALVATGGTFSTAANADMTQFSQDKRTIFRDVSSGASAATALGQLWTAPSTVGSYTISMYKHNGTDAISLALPAQTLIAKITVSVVASSVGGTYSPVYSVCNTSSTTSVPGSTAATANVDSTATVTNGNVWYINLALADSYQNALDNGNIVVTATNGAFVNYAEAGTAAVGTGSTVVANVNASPYGSVTVSQPTANAPLTTTVTISYNGTTVCTKTVSIRGEVAKIAVSNIITQDLGNDSGVAESSWIEDGSGRDGLFTVLATDSAGNQVATSTIGTFASSAASLAGQTIISSVSVHNSATATSSTAAQRYSTGKFTCGGVAGDVKTTKLTFTNTSSGNVVTSDAFTLRCADNPYTYTASWDKASYVQGEIATLTVKFLDSKGFAANNVAGAAGTWVGSTPMLTPISATGAAPVLDNNGTKTYTYSVGGSTAITAGSYVSVIDFASLTAGTKQTPSYKVSTGGDSTTNADVLKSIVALIASINKQIQALQKLILKR